MGVRCTCDLPTHHLVISAHQFTYAKTNLSLYQHSGVDLYVMNGCANGYFVAHTMGCGSCSVVYVFLLFKIIDSLETDLVKYLCMMH